MSSLRGIQCLGGALTIFCASVFTAARRRGEADFGEADFGEADLGELDLGELAPDFFFLDTGGLLEQLPDEPSPVASPLARPRLAVVGLGNTSGPTALQSGRSRSPGSLISSSAAATSAVRASLV